VRDRRLAWPAVGLVALLAAWNNLVVPAVPGPPAMYVVVNVGATVALLVAARAAGLSRTELGLASRDLPSGLRWGGACLALVAAGYLVALAAPALRPLLTDARVEGMGGAEVAYAALVRIPLGTVLWEEVAFRGVLLAVLARLLPLRWAVAGTAALFGLWHVRPTLAALAANDLVDTAVATAALVLLACAFTALAGVLFAWLRLRSGSLLAPVLLHLSTNSLGTLAAAVAVRMAA
jgi:uncharacterized protein